PAHAAGRTDHGGWLRHRPREHGGRVAQHSNLLRSDAGCARARHLRARAVALAPEPAVEIANQLTQNRNHILSRCAPAAFIRKFSRAPDFLRRIFGHGRSLRRIFSFDRKISLNLADGPRKWWAGATRRKDAP